jgi:large subunit ribosomal protein L24
MNNKMNIKTGDSVILLKGKYSQKFHKDGKRRVGKVLEVSPKEGKVIVEGFNKVQKHVKPRRMGEQGGIVEAEAPIYACKVQIVCPRCQKPTRVAHKLYEDGTKGRICKKCGEAL